MIRRLIFLILIQFSLNSRAEVPFLPPGELRNLQVASLPESTLDLYLSRYALIFNLQPLEPQGEEPKFKYALGKKAFFDKRLSGNQNISCSSCHQPTHGTTDYKAVAASGRNTPALYNTGRSDYSIFFWDGRLRFDPAKKEIKSPYRELSYSNPIGALILKPFTKPLAAEVLFPLVNPKEMLGQRGENEIADAPSVILSWSRIFRRLEMDPIYKELLRQAYPNTLPMEFNMGHVSEAIASFISEEYAAENTPLDSYLSGNRGALSLDEKRGFFLFASKGGCLKCHGGPYLSNFTLQNTGIFGANPGDGSSMRSGINLKFRVPALRNIARTAPYGHDGSFQTIRQVIEHYQNLGIKNKRTPNLAYQLENTILMTPIEIQYLELFLTRSLTSRKSKIQSPTKGLSKKTMNWINIKETHNET